MSISSKFNQKFRDAILHIKHTLYMQLLTLLLCITFSVFLMQAGSLFLRDYIPGINHEIREIVLQEMFWQQQYDSLSNMHPDKVRESILKLDKYPLATDLNKPEWLKSQSNIEIVNALKAIKIAQIKFDQARMNQDDLKGQIDAVRDLAVDYRNLNSVLERDIEIKQSVVSLLQLIALVLIMSCLGTIAYGARRLLVDRVDALISFVPVEFAKGDRIIEIDEFADLERVVYEISARLEGYKSESEWFSKVSSERVRRMVRSQDFLHKFVDSANNSVLSETSLRRGLYLLERALNVNNVALIFTENDSVAFTERVLFSHHKPASIKENLLDELTSVNFIRFVSTSEFNRNSQCLAVGFTCPSGALGVLKIEADEDHAFDESEIQLVEVTAKLLSMVMGFKGREQEGRRVALLEERAAIARELHDSLAQSLSFMKIQIARLQSKASGKLSTTTQNDIVNELREGLDNAYSDLRELLSTFRLHIDVRGLSFAIQSAIDEYVQRSSLTITLDNRLENNRLTVNEEFHILHVIREALSNITRHSGASRVNITLAFQAGGTILVNIDDDGVGYKAKEEGFGHYGQKIMKERALSLGGDIAVLRRRTGGTRVRLVFTPKLPQ